MNFDDKILQDFIAESQEHLQGIEEDLLSIEAAGAEADSELVNQVFRAVHSIKGGAGFLELEKLAELAHYMENVLNQVRNGTLLLDDQSTSALLVAADVLAAMVADPASSKEREIGAEVAALQAISDSSGTATATAPPATPQEEKQDALHTLEIAAEVIATGLECDSYVYLVEYRQEDGKNPAEVLSELEATVEVLEQYQQEGAFFVAFATAADPDVVADLLEVDPQRIRALASDEELEEPIAPSSTSGPLAPPREEEDEPAAPFSFAGPLAPIAEEEDKEEPEETTFSPVRLQAIAAEELAPEVQLLADDQFDDEPLDSDLDEELPPEALVAEALVAEALVAEDISPDQDLPFPGPFAPVRAAAAPAQPVQSPAAAAPEMSVSEKPEPSPQLHSAGGGGSRPPTESTLRVHVRLLDQLMNLAGELVLTRNQLKQMVASGDGKQVEHATQHLDLVTTELQEAIVSTRMQAVDNVFGRFRRVVRDLARELKKEVTLVIEGEEVELDKTIIEALSDPLTHLVRNSMDHGIEPPEQRRQLGKPLPATVRLSAFHEAGQVIIEVADDGGGIDGQKVAEKALSNGQLDAVQLKAMGEKELVKLIFQPGFSTVEEVTDLSGRGVGMDVVYTNLTRLGGVVDIDTEVGVGTTIRIKLPLTLAIIPSLLLTCGGDRFAIPQVNLAELVRVPARQMHERIQQIGSAQVLRLRGELLPLISLRKVLNMEVEEDGLEHTTFVLVLKAGDFHYGLIVDELLDSEEIVVKPLDDYLSSCAIYAGATIQGDGRVALILDVVGISSMLELEAVNRLQEAAAEQEEDASAPADEQLLLLLRNAADEQFALPVNLIARIERIHRSQIEVAGGITSMQYQGRHLLLLRLEQAVDVKPIAEIEYPSVIVFTVADRELGLLVSQVLDILADRVDITDQEFSQPGILGSAIVDGQTTLIIDLYGLVRKIEPEWLERQERSFRNVHNAGVLVAEDTAFFRNQMQKSLDEAGYRTYVAEDGAAALELLKARISEIDLLVTDIEMPRMDGLELARQVRADERLAGLPIIAVTTLSGEEHEHRGYQAGIDDYLIKLDQEQLLRTVHQRLEQDRETP